MAYSMFDWTEISLLVASTSLLILRFLPYFRTYHPLIGGGGVLLLITALFPRPGNPLGAFLFGQSATGPRLPRELFGVV